MSSRGRPREHCPGPRHRRCDVVDDIAAAMSGSGAVLARSPAAAHLAASLGAPVAALDAGFRDRFDPAIRVLAGDLAAAVQTLLASKEALAIDAAVMTLDGAFAE